MHGSYNPSGPRRQLQHISTCSIKPTALQLFQSALDQISHRTMPSKRRAICIGSIVRVSQLRITVVASSVDQRHHEGKAVTHHFVSERDAGTTHHSKSNAQTLTEDPKASFRQVHSHAEIFRGSPSQPEIRVVTWVRIGTQRNVILTAFE